MDGLRFGRQYRALRIRLERRQSDVAKDARLSRSQISLVDRGRIDGVTVGPLARAAAALGADLDVRLRWRGEQLDRLTDESHATVVEVIVRRLRRLGWIVEVEVSFSIWGERGSIDVFAFHPGMRALLVVEVKSVIADSQATLHGLDRKVRLAVEIAKGEAGNRATSAVFSWSPHPRRRGGGSPGWGRPTTQRCQLAGPSFDAGSPTLTGRWPGCCLSQSTARTAQGAV